MRAAALALALASAGLGVSIAAQAQPRWTMPRTQDGQPDLQGTYDVSTITPIDRPASYGDRLVMTAAEAAALERAEAVREERLNESNAGDQNRTAPPVGGATPNPNATPLERAFEAGGGVVGGYNNFWMAPGSHVVTINGQKRSSIIIDPPSISGAP